MNESILFHRGNEWEWRFVGIWADMLNSNISKSLQNFSIQDALVLFGDYENPLEILQENLRLRNQYNKFNFYNSKDDMNKMEEIINGQIADITEKSELCIYYENNIFRIKMR